MDVRMCYNILPVPTWFQTHRELDHQGGVVFYMNCLRMESEVNLDIIITIQSLPLKSDAPKLANTTIFVRPESTINRWNPQIKKWTDASDVLHVIIENPLKDAMFYSIQIQSMELAQVVFRHTVPATPGDTNLDNLQMFTTDGKPHILIYDLKKDDNYSILLDALDGNGTQLSHVMSVETKPFSLNFSREYPLAVDSGVLASPIVVVLVLAVVVAVALAGLGYKGVLRYSRLPAGVGRVACKSTSRLLTTPTFTAIYCYDNDDFGHAVENHIGLLHRYINIVTEVRSHHKDFSFSNDSWSSAERATESKNCDIIIYLSPRLGEILTFGNETIPSLSCKDALCYNSLLTLRENSLTDENIALHLVTFDCFQTSEAVIIKDLLAFIFPRKQDFGAPRPTPLRLTSLTPDGWRLENLEQLLLALFHQQQFPKDVVHRLHGWRESPEAGSVIRYHNLVNSSVPNNTVDTASAREQEISSMAVGLNTPCTESKFDNGSNKQKRVFNKTCTTKQKNFKVNNNIVELPLPLHVHLLSKFNGYKSRSANCLQGNGSAGLNRSISVSNATVASYNKNQVSPLVSQTTLMLPNPPQTTEDEANLGPESRIILPRATRSKVIDYPVQFFNSGSLSWIGNLNNQKKSVFLHEDSDDYEWNDKKRLGVAKSGYSIIPPSLSHIGCSSTDSVCECINKINDSSSWFDSNQLERA